MGGAQDERKLPDDVREALEATPEAYAAFLLMPPSHRRQYLDFIDEVKSPAARARRILRALERMSEWRSQRDEGAPPLEESRKVTIRERPPTQREARRTTTDLGKRRSGPG